MPDPAAPTPPAPVLTRPLVLVGLMASGKSTVGQRVASRLGLPFVDTDAEIEQRRGCTVAELFVGEGEAAFRTVEAEVLADLLAGGPTVIATGGGAVVGEQNRRLLRARATVVWLQAPPAVLASRVRPDGSRPLLGDDPRGTLERLAGERGPLYAEVADHVVDVAEGDRRTVVRRILDLLSAESATGTPADPSTARLPGGSSATIEPPRTLPGATTESDPDPESRLEQPS